MAFQVSKSTITRERSIVLQIHELKSKKTWLEAYRNSYLHFIDPWAAVAVYTHTQIHRYTDTQTHKHTTVYLACACAPRHNEMHGQKNFFSQMITSTLPLPACKNLALYDALNGPSVEVEQTHQTCFFYNEIYWLREGEFPLLSREFPISLLL